MTESSTQLQARKAADRAAHLKSRENKADLALGRLARRMVEARRQGRTSQSVMDEIEEAAVDGYCKRAKEKAA